MTYQRIGNEGTSTKKTYHNDTKLKVEFLPDTNLNIDLGGVGCQTLKYLCWYLN